jgi:hypothetical protein
MASSHDDVNVLYAQSMDEAAWSACLAAAHAQVSQWRWATESMSFDTPFSCELFGGAAPRWLADDGAKPGEHVHHGLDAQGRIVVERVPGSHREQVLIHKADQRIKLEPGSVYVNRYANLGTPEQRLLATHIHMGWGGHDTEHVWQGNQLLRSVSRSWRDTQATWDCQITYTYADDGELTRIDLQYLDDKGQVLPGRDRLQYLRLPKGETLKTVEARVQDLLLQALPAAIAQVPRDEPLYAMFLCFTHEDPSAAWPPFLVWADAPYRERVLADKLKNAPYALWAPDEIRKAASERSGQPAPNERWFDGPEHQALREACLLHAQLMAMKQSEVPAMRVLKAVVPVLENLVRQSGLPLTDDFVALTADNTGEVNPLKAMKKRLAPERWASLKAKGLV